MSSLAASASLTDQVGQASNLLGLLLALNTLLTAEQARRLSEERNRDGGARSSHLWTIIGVSAGLGLVTVGALAALFSLFRKVFESMGTPSWQGVLGVFELSWILLIALFFWQVALVIIAVRSRT